MKKRLTDRITRRSALKIIGAGAASIYLPGCASSSWRSSRALVAQSLINRTIASRALVTSDGRDFNPMDRTLGARGPRSFSGDDAGRAHQILRDKDGYIARRGGKIPAPSERVPLVVVGGGLSGAMAAYLHRAHKPVILERADRMGGNARGESWEGIDYSLGPTYFAEPEKDSALEKLYRELGLDTLTQHVQEEDSVHYQGKVHKSFWSGATDPSAKAQFRKLHQYFMDTYEGENGRVYPVLPILDPSTEKAIKELDGETFKEHLEKVVGGRLHPHIETALEHYCWSSFGAPFAEIGAASGLNFYVAELGKLWLVPGGTGAVVERILERTLAGVPRECFRPGCVVIDVQVVDDGVIVAYEDAQQAFKSIHAKAVVVASPKFTAPILIDDLEPARVEAIAKLRYNSYLVANVMVEGAVPKDFYAVTLLADGKIEGDIRTVSQKHQVTDVILSSYTSASSSHGVLTLFRPLPYAGARMEVIQGNAYAKYRAEFEAQLSGEILPAFGIAPSRVKDVRLTRWGHPLPVAARGLIADGTVETIRRPFRDRVFFINQDNWALPSFETGVTEALTWRPEIEKVLRKG